MRMMADLRKAAEKGTTAYETALGHAYLIGKDWEGNEIPVDFSEAMRWLQPARI